MEERQVVSLDELRTLQAASRRVYVEPIYWLASQSPGRALASVT
jgi:hypothetical protein